LARWPAQLIASTFNQLGQYANSPGHRVHCYTELSMFFPNGSCNRRYLAYPWRNNQAEFACVAWLNTETLYPQMVTHLSTNPAQRRVTSLMCPTMLALSQTATTSVRVTLIGLFV